MRGARNEPPSKVDSKFDEVNITKYIVGISDTIVVGPTIACTL
jgi:hypothetical protein